MFYFLKEFNRAPPPVRDALLSADIATTNLNGTNWIGNIEKDETLEVSIGKTKDNAHNQTAESLKKSFYTVAGLASLLIL